MHYLRPLFGFIILVGIAYLFSKDRKSINWRLVGIGLLSQIIIGVLILKVSAINWLLSKIGSGFVKVMSFAEGGATMVFGDLARDSNSAAGVGHSMGVIFAFQVLPIIVFFATLTSALYYWGILQRVVAFFAWIVTKIIPVSGAESLSATGNVFIGQAEAPLLVKPFLAKMSKSQILCIMTAGMATIAGSVMAAYVKMLSSNPEEQTLFASHLLAASIMNVPAAIVMAKIILPDKKGADIDDAVKLTDDHSTYGNNIIDALAKGASEGVKLAVNVGGMLLAFMAVIYLLNFLLKDVVGASVGLNDWIIRSSNGQFDGFTMQYVFGQAFRLIAYCIGVEWADTLHVGSLLGQKTVFNEFIAYQNLAGIKESGILSERSIYIATYALCGFSNFGSIAIQIGGIGSLAPNQKGNLSKLGFRAILGATIACLLSANIAGVLYGS